MYYYKWVYLQISFINKCVHYVIAPVLRYKANAKAPAAEDALIAEACATLDLAEEQVGNPAAVSPRVVLAYIPASYCVFIVL